MSRNSNLMALRDARIKERYRELSGGKERLKPMEIITKLTLEFYLTERTISDIVYGTNTTVKRNVQQRATQ